MNKKSYIKRLTLLLITLIFALSCTLANGEVENKEQSSPPGSDERREDILVIYFSATGNTERVAHEIAEHLGSDIFEIEPVEPYSSNDLNYSESSSRTSREQNDPMSRPEIKGLPSVEPYDIVFLGYPIWWGEAPKIMYTLVEGIDLNGKRVIPFCTSGSSSIGSSARNLSKVAQGGDWESGKRLTTSSADVDKWIDGLGL